LFITQFRHNGEILSVTPDGQGARKNICTHGILTENTLYLQTWEKVFVDKTTRWSQTKNMRYLHTKERSCGTSGRGARRAPTYQTASNGFSLKRLSTSQIETVNKGQG